MSTNSFKIKKSLVVDPQAGSVVSEKGELAYNVATDKYEGYTSSADPIVQEAKTSTLTNKNLGNSNNTLSGATAATLVSGAGTLTLNTSGTATVPNATDTLVGKDTTDILTNKTIGNALTVTQIATPSNPSAGLNKIYTKADGSLYNLNSSGIESQIGAGSGGVKNYLGTVNNVNGNGNFELGSTSGFSLGTATLTTNFPSGVPTFGSGASGNLSVAVVSSGQLAGSYSLSYISSAATTAGNFVASSAFAIDSVDQAKVLQFKFAYKAQTNPTNANFSGTSSNSFGVAIYDVTNSAWIQPAGVFNIIQSSGVGISSGTFQTSSNGTSYRIVFYNANASAGAITMYLDDFFVGPQVIVSGMTGPVGEIISSAATIVPSGFLLCDGAAISRTQYSDLFLVIGTTYGVGDSSTTFNVPNAQGVFLRGAGSQTIAGIVSTGTQGTTQGDQMQGHYHVVVNTTSVGGSASDYTAAATVSVGVISAINNNTGFIAGDPYTNGVNGTPRVGSENRPANIVVKYFIRFLAGYQMSSDAATRVVAASVANTAGTSIPTNTDTAVPYATTTYDTHSAFSGSSFTAPVSGYYRLTTTQTWDSANFLNVVLDLMFKKNGSTVVARTLLYPQTSTGLSWSQTLSQTIKLNAGEYAGVYVAQGSGGSRTLLTGTGTNVFAVEQVQGPSNISSVETVAARSNATPTSSAFNNTAYLIFSAVSYDTHAEYSTSTGLYTTPISGIYNFGGQFGMSGGSVGGYLEIVVYVNGSSAYNFIPATLATGEQFIPLNLDIKLNAGDTVGFRWNTDKSSPAVSGGTTKNTLSLHRVGN